MTARTIFACTCEDSMPLDGRALTRGCGAGAAIRTAENLCRTQLDRFTVALAEGRPLTIGCTQEAPLFQQEAEAAGFGQPIAFANIRETAGWSTEAAKAGPKMAALLAAAALPVPETPLVGLVSEGVTLLLGRDATALAVAERLKHKLDLTVLLTGEAEVTPPRQAEYPVLRGKARTATGWLGNFEVVVDGHAAPSPASRGAYSWGMRRDGARSRADLVLDLTGGAPLFPLAETRQGYLRANPDNAAEVEKLVAAAGELVGEFDQPRFIDFTAGLCAHGRNKRTGCTRCLDLCPTGAITPGRDSVVITAEICAGCGACAAVCPTGAASYALPPPGFTLGRLRTLLQTYTAAGGTDAVLLLHDEAHGEALIDALARHGDGLPAQVLPLRVNEVSQTDLAMLAAALAWGAAGVRLLLPAHRPHGVAGALGNLGTLDAALAGMGLADGPARLAAIEADDPFTLGEALRAPMPRLGWSPASFLALGTSREILKQALAALHPATAPALVPLPAGAPLGAALVKAEGCTLCLACTMACPTQAFSANPDRPQLSFLEDACVQCGLCVATCPEQVISLVPRLNFAPEAAQPQVVKAEDPFLCTRCAKPFGTRSSIEKVKQKLAASHWMFADPKRLAVLELCEDCRVVEATTGGLDPYAGTPRPRPRTAEDLD
jgi:ferredoxin